MAVKTKSAILAEIASLLADNTTGDISASDVRTCLNDIVDSYPEGGAKVYKALLTQSGTSAPVATVLVNTLSGTPVWSRSSAGVYFLNLTGEFITTKTIVSVGRTNNNGGGGAWTYVDYFTFNQSDDYVTLVSFDVDLLLGTQNFSDDIITIVPITIEVYP